MAQDIVIGGRFHSAATGNTVAGANEILDDAKGKKQNVINQEVDNEIGTDETSGTIKGRIKELENAVGDGGSVDERIADAAATVKSDVTGDAASDYNTFGKVEDKIQAEVFRAEGAEEKLDAAKANKATTLEGYGITDAYTKSETYNKNEVNGLVSTPHQNYVTVATYAALIAIDPGNADTIYRVSSYDGSTSQVDDTVYSEYAWDGTQYVFLCVKSQIDQIFDISVYNNNATYTDLTEALGTNGANVPQSLQKGGMSVKFVQTSDNKYVQYRLMSQTFSTDEADWQGVDVKPIDGSHNLAESGGVALAIFNSETYSNRTRLEIEDIDINGIQVKAGQILKERYPLYLKTGESLKVKVSGETGLWSSNPSLVTINLLLSDYSRGPHTNLDISLEQEYEFIDLPADIICVEIARTVAAINDGLINLKLYNTGDIATNSDVDSKIEIVNGNIDELDEKNTNQQFLTNSLEVVENAVAGEDFNLELDVDIPAFEPFAVSIDSGNLNAFDDVNNETYGVIPNCANIYVTLDDETKVNRYISAFGDDYKVFLQLSKAVRKISIRKASSTVVNNTDVTLKVVKIDCLQSIDSVSKNTNQCIFGGTIQDSCSANKNQNNFIFIIPVYIPAGIPGSIKISTTDESAITNNLLSTYWIDDLRDIEPPASGYRHNIYADGQYHTFTHNKPIYGVNVRRDVTGVVGNAKISVEIKNNAVIAKGEPVYVDAVNGSDDNAGTLNAPFATFDKAINSTGEDTTIIFEGDTTESLNIKTKTNQRTLTLIGKSGKRNRIVKGKTFSNISAVSGEIGIYSANFASSLLPEETYRIYQHEVHDARTLIDDDNEPFERSPYQRGRTHRCESTKIINAGSLAGVRENLTNNIYSYYYDDANSIVYFSAPSSDFNAHPIYCPSGTAGIGGNDGSVEVHIVNIESWYGPIRATDCNNSVFEDCAAKFSYGAGAIRYDHSVGISFIRCEASSNTNTGTTGDGFNGHGTADAVPGLPKVTTCQLIDCWSHDNNDDGYSDHENCETIVRGGLYEYNQKSGCTPASGAQSACYDVVSRHNLRGFYYINPSSDMGIYGQALFVNCVADNNSIAGFAVTSNNNQVTCIGCKSMNNPIGYHLAQKTYMKCVDCTSSNDSVATQNQGTGELLIINSERLV